MKRSIPWTWVVIGLVSLALSGIAIWRFTQSPYDTIDNIVPRSESGLSVLFVGNSHTSAYRVPRMVARMAPEGTKPIHFETRVAAWKDLRWHAANSGVELLIAENRFDVVVLQTLPSEVLNSTEEYRSVVSTFSKGVRPVVWEPWPHLNEGKTDVSMATIQRELSGMNATPIGTAIVDAYKNGVGVFDEDGVHATELGSFIAAVHLCEAIYETSRDACLKTSFATQEKYAKALGFLSAAPQ